MSNNLTLKSVLRLSVATGILIAACYSTRPLPAMGDAPTPLELAEEALTGIDAVGSITEENLDVVEPFETTAPPEADLTNATIESAIEDRRARGDTVEGQAFHSLEDSASSRPEYNIETDDPLITRTEAITDAAPETIGDLFTSNGSGICEVEDFDGTPLIDAYCERSQDIEERSCTDTLEVTLDRHDSWRCIRIPEVYPQTCHQRANVTCNNPPNCLISALNYSVSVPEFHADSYPVPTRPGGWWKDPVLPAGHGVSGQSYIAQESEHALTLLHMFYGKYPFSSVWETPSPYAPSTRTISFNPESTGVAFTRFEVEFVYEVWGAAGTSYTPPDCRPRVLLNGSSTLINGPIYPGFQYQTGSDYGPCRAFSDVVNDQSPSYRYRPDSQTFNLLPFLQSGLPINLEITTQGAGLRGMKTIFHVEGSCCLNPTVTYENLSCE